MVDIDWQSLDAEIAATPMPEEYRDMKVAILCRDCHQVCRVNFHVLGLKCQNTQCGSYNTCRTDDPDDQGEAASGSELDSSSEARGAEGSTDDSMNTEETEKGLQEPDLD